jgi:hypothetical protein
VRFAIRSHSVTASEMTARLGVEPDSLFVRASRPLHPPVPRFHQRTVRCDLPGLTVEDQIARVVARLDPFRSQIADLVTELANENPPGDATLIVVRHFDDEDGEEESEYVRYLPDGTMFERLPGQHQLLGWHLDTATLAFLRFVGAELDVDEYG